MKIPVEIYLEFHMQFKDLYGIWFDIEECPTHAIYIEGLENISSPLGNNLYPYNYDDDGDVYIFLIDDKAKRHQTRGNTRYFLDSDLDENHDHYIYTDSDHVDRLNKIKC